jgi:hypothetical protein
MYKEERIFVGLMLLIGFLIIAAVVCAVQENRACEAAGGEMQGTGEYYTTYIRSNNVLIPVRRQRYECSVEIPNE